MCVYIYIYIDHTYIDIYGYINNEDNWSIYNYLYTHINKQIYKSKFSSLTLVIVSV